MPYLNDLTLGSSVHWEALLWLLAMKGTQCLVLWKDSVTEEYLFFNLLIYIWVQLDANCVCCEGVNILCSIYCPLMSPAFTRNLNFIFISDSYKTRSFLQRFAAGRMHGDANPQSSDTQYFTTTFTKAMNCGQLTFHILSRKVRRTFHGTDWCFLCLFWHKDLSEINFFNCSSSCLNWLILLEIARIKHIIAIEDTLCPAVSEAKQVIGYAHRLRTFCEQCL